MNINGLLLINKAGLNGNQTNLDIIANNIANANTTGYRAQNGSFQTLIANQVSNREVPLSANQQIDITAGMKVNAGVTDFKQGGLQTTGIKTDLAISGNGFFGVIGNNNQLMLTRAGNFELDADNNLVTANGLHVATTNTIPQNQWPKGILQIDPTGRIVIANANTNVQVGRINLYQPNSYADIHQAGDNLFAPNAGVNLAPVNGQPGIGLINQGMLEFSNADLSSQLTDMITTQRAFQLNAKALQATDDILNTTNNFNQ